MRARRKELPPGAEEDQYQEITPEHRQSEEATDGSSYATRTERDMLELEVYSEALLDMVRREEDAYVQQEQYEQQQEEEQLSYL